MPSLFSFAITEFVITNIDNMKKDINRECSGRERRRKSECLGGGLAHSKSQGTNVLLAKGGLNMPKHPHGLRWKPHWHYYMATQGVFEREPHKL